MYRKSETPMGGLSVTEARADFADTLRRVADRGERVRLSRSGKEVAAMVPIADLELLEALEDHADLEAVREALKSGRRVPYLSVRRKLKL
jgi:prevent-host-death family protein